MMSAQSHIVGLRGNKAFTQDALIWDKNDARALPPVAIKDLNFDLDLIKFDTPLPNGLIPFPVHVPDDSLDLKLGADGGACPTNGKQMKHDRSATQVELENEPKMNQLIKDALDFYKIKDYKGTKGFRLCYLLGDFVR
jgi:hypothetical protein